MAVVTAGEAREMADSLAILDAAGVDDLVGSGRAVDDGAAHVRREVLTNSDSVQTALNEEFDDALANHLIVRRPGNRLLVDFDIDQSAGHHLE